MTMIEVKPMPTGNRQGPDTVGGGPPTLGVGRPLRKNTHSAGACLRPATLVGHDNELQDWSVALQRAENARSAKSVVLHGPGGAERTALLGEFQRRAEDRDWMTVIMEASKGRPFRGTLARALYPVVRELVRPGPGDKLTKALVTVKAFGVKVDLASTWSFGFDGAAERGHAGSEGLEADLSELIRDLTEAAQEQSRGLAILIDEAQDLTSDELKALCAVCREGGQCRWPFLVAVAGLPCLPDAVLNASSSAEDLFRDCEIAKAQPGAARQTRLARPPARACRGTRKQSAT